MEINFSRHAKKRAKLYRISEPTIVDILTGANLGQGKNEIIKNVVGFKYPLKVIAVVDRGLTMVISSYPLKKGRKK